VLLDDVTDRVGHEHILDKEKGEAMPLWQEALFAAMARNASRVTDDFRLTMERVVEIGWQVSNLTPISVRRRRHTGVSTKVSCGTSSLPFVSGLNSRVMTNTIAAPVVANNIGLVKPSG